MAQPRALQDALKASDEMIEEMAKAEKPQTDPDQYLREAAQEAEAEKAEQPEKEPEQPEPQTEAPEADYERLKASYDSLENKYRVLEGKYKAEVPRYAAEVRELKDQITALQQQKQEQPPPADENVSKIKEKLLDTYTEEEVDALEGLIRHYVKPKDSSSDEIRELKTKLANMETMTREQQLTALVPDWRQIESQSRDQWVAFLQEINPESGQERNAHLREAWQAGDVPRVAKIFELFKSQRPSKPAEPPVEPEPRGAERKPVSADRKVWKASEIEEVSRLFHRGAFRGREQEYEALRDRIEKATVEGRIDPTR